MDKKKEYIERGLAVQLLRECTQMQGKEIEKECDMPILRNVLNVYYLAREGAATLLEDIPAADVVEVVHGEWCWEGKFKACSKCGSYVEWNETLGANFWKYCPFCGAKMDGERKEE